MALPRTCCRLRCLTSSARLSSAASSTPDPNSRQYAGYALTRVGPGGISRSSASCLSACGDPITGSVNWFVNPSVSEHVVVDASGQDVLHVVLNQDVLLGSYPVGAGRGPSAGVAILEVPGSSFREDCTFDVRHGIKLPVPLSRSPLSGVCTLILATGSFEPSHHNKVYIARGKATGVYAKLPSLSGSGTLEVRRRLHQWPQRRHGDQCLPRESRRCLVEGCLGLLPEGRRLPENRGRRRK